MKTKGEWIIWNYIKFNLCTNSTIKEKILEEEAKLIDGLIDIDKLQYKDYDKKSLRFKNLVFRLIQFLEEGIRYHFAESEESIRIIIKWLIGFIK